MFRTAFELSAAEDDQGWSCTDVTKDVSLCSGRSSAIPLTTTSVRSRDKVEDSVKSYSPIQYKSIFAGKHSAITVGRDGVIVVVLY